jgi:probable HAF family extracellular repeat protein
LKRLQVKIILLALGTIMCLAGNAFAGGAWLYSDGTMTALNNDNAYGINDLGQIVGNTARPPFVGIGRDITNSGQIVNFSAFTESSPSRYNERGVFYPAAINDKGQMAGWKNYHACLYSDGTLTDLGTLQGGNISFALGINNLGQVVGMSINSSNGDYTAFLYSDGAMTAIERMYCATGINDLGQIVGYDGGGWHRGGEAFLYDSVTGGYTDLGVLQGYASSYAMDINNLGQVVGYSSTPLPPTPLLFGSGLIGLIGWRRYTRKS